MAKKKKTKTSRKVVPARGPMRPQAPPPGAYMKPEWRRKVFGEGGEREAPPQTSEEALERALRAKRAALPFWLRPFEWMRPTPEEAARRQRRGGGVPIEDVIVPRSERERVRQESERFRRGGFQPHAPIPPVPPVRPSGEAPYRTSPPPRYGGTARREAPEGAPPRREAWNPMAVFDLPKIWDHIRNVKRDPRFRGMIGVGRLSPEGRSQAERAKDVARFFRVPEEELSRPDLWQAVAAPLLREVEAALNREKPPDIPGRLKFGESETGSFGLIYEE